jgi:hypothetical protein
MVSVYLFRYSCCCYAKADLIVYGERIGLTELIHAGLLSCLVCQARPVLLCWLRPACKVRPLIALHSLGAWMLQCLVD